MSHGPFISPHRAEGYLREELTSTKLTAAVLPQNLHFQKDTFSFSLFFACDLGIDHYSHIGQCKHDQPFQISVDGICGNLTYFELFHIL